MSRLWGAWKRAAQRSGVPLLLYAERRLRGQRWCYACRSWGPAEAFPLDRTTPHNPDQRKSICRDCQSRRNRQRTAGRRQAASERVRA